MMLRIGITGAVIPLACGEDVPEIFKGLFENDVPVKAEVGIVVPPPELDSYIAKVEAAARENSEWFQNYSSASEPGTPLPYHENLGLSRAEYDEYLALWRKREFRPIEEVILLLRKNASGAWSVVATGEAGVISTLRFDPETKNFRSPNGELKRLDDVKTHPDSILGEWSGAEWRLEKESLFGETKENIAIGKFADGKYGIMIYRAQEISSEGTRLMDRSMVVRFVLGEAGQMRQPGP